MKMLDRDAMMYWLLQVCRIVAAYNKLGQPMVSHDIADLLVAYVKERRPARRDPLPVHRLAPRPDPGRVGYILSFIVQRHGKATDGNTLELRGDGYGVCHHYVDRISEAGNPYRAHSYAFAATAGVLTQDADTLVEGLCRDPVWIELSADDWDAGAHNLAQVQTLLRNEPAETGV